MHVMYYVCIYCICLDSMCFILLHRADADGDAPCANAKDNAACIHPRAEGKPSDGLRTAGMSVPTLGKPA